MNVAGDREGHFRQPGPGPGRVQHHTVGPLELTYHPLVLPTSLQIAHTLTAYVAEPGRDSTPPARDGQAGRP